MPCGRHMTNVIRVPPRRYRVLHKGCHGWVEYHPGTKMWSYKLKWQTTFTHRELAPTEAEAVLELKASIDALISGGSTTARTVD